MKPKLIFFLSRSQKSRSLVLSDHLARHFQIAFHMVTSVSMHKQDYGWVWVIKGTNMDCHQGSGGCLSKDLVHWLLFWGNVALIMRVREKLVHRRKVALMLAKANVSSIWSRQLVSNQGLIDIS